MKKKGSPLLRDLRENRTKWLMLVPAAVVVILMCYIPMSGIDVYKRQVYSSRHFS